MPWRSILVWDYMTGPQTMLTVITILVLTRPRNWSTCSVSHIIKTTLAKNTSVKWLKFSCVVPAFPLGSYHSQLWAGSGQGRKIPHDWWDLNPRPSDLQSKVLTTLQWGPVCCCIFPYDQAQSIHTTSFIKKPQLCTCTLSPSPRCQERAKDNQVVTGSIQPAV